MKPSILVVDDEKLIRWSLREALREAGYEVDEADTGATALAVIGERSYDAILLDYRLPDIDGLEILRRLRDAESEASVIMITAHSNVEHAVEAMRAGAADYVPKPFRNEDIVLRVQRAIETGRMRSELRRLKQESSRYRFDRVVGESPAIKRVLDLVSRVIHSPRATILLEGESGTGKDVFAKAIHYGGPRADGPYTNITCTAIPEQLLESEMFGHEKGAFTDARTQRKGLAELADGGTLFLDEIGDMSPYLQGKLLRFLEDKTFRRVGGDRDISVDVRVIAATNRDLKDMVNQKTFREDLYFRLKVIPIRLPPLRERVEDIPLLVDHFIHEFNREFKKNVAGVSDALLERLMNYDWPGNIRELRNTVERLMILGSGTTLDAENLPFELFDEPVEGGTHASRIQLTRKGVVLEDVERDLVEQALSLTSGNQTRAGRLLGLNRDQVRYRIEKFGLSVPAKSPGDETPGG